MVTADAQAPLAVLRWAAKRQAAYDNAFHGLAPEKVLEIQTAARELRAFLIAHRTDQGTLDLLLVPDVLTMVQRFVESLALIGAELHADAYGFRVKSRDLRLIGNASLHLLHAIEWPVKGVLYAARVPTPPKHWVRLRAVLEHKPAGVQRMIAALGLMSGTWKRPNRTEVIVSPAALQEAPQTAAAREAPASKAAERAASGAAKRKTLRKRATRAATIDALQTEMTEHIIAARDHGRAAIQRDEPPVLLPRPKQKDLAARLGIGESAVSRALHDPNAVVLKVLWGTAQDLDQTLKFRSSRRS